MPELHGYGLVAALFAACVYELTSIGSNVELVFVAVLR